MKRKVMWRSAICLFVFLSLQLICIPDGFSYCLHRDTGALEIPPGSDEWVEECCSGRPSHWPASAMPIPVWIYAHTPADFDQDIRDAVDTWNNIESSYFQMNVIGYTYSTSPVPGAIVMGFDPDHCADDNDCGIAGTGCKAISVDNSWDGYQIQHCVVWADANAHNWNAPGGPNSLMVMTHELGHVLGIMHPGDNPHGPGGQGCGPEFNGATMACCGGQLDAATLELDDIAAATSLYPNWKYTVEVVDSTNNPIEGASVWMDGTCFPHEGEDRHEGGMVFGDIPSCLTGESEPSNTYYPNLTYTTGANGQTGKFRVIHDQFCITVVADGYQDSYGCQTLLAPGNYITTVVLNKPPVCDANGPYNAECQGEMTMLTLDGTGSYDPDPNDTISYSWLSDCPGGSFDSPTKSQPIINIDTSTGALICTGTLTVEDNSAASDTCSSSVTIVDTLPPNISCPENVTIECDESTLPTNTGFATADDVCDSTPTIAFNDTVAPGSCPSQFTISRNWTATDGSGNVGVCVQTIQVVDTTPPDISVSVSPDTLWSPNHKMMNITPTITVADNCDSDPLVELVSITSNEGDDIEGDGHTSDDIHVNNDGTLSLRAERSGKGSGRIYTITYSATDGCGNRSVTSATVNVSHNK